jgi:hypothetical protein
MLRSRLSAYTLSRMEGMVAGSFARTSLISPRRTTMSTRVFLEGALKWLGFHRTWIIWVMECVTTISYSTSVSITFLWSPSNPHMDYTKVIPSPEIQQGALQELQISRRVPSMSHLLFTDDTLLFMEANIEQVEIIRVVLNKYEKGIGQLINPSKCLVMFGYGCQDANKDSVKFVLGVHSTVQEEKYIGLPTSEGTTNKDRFKSRN